MAVDRRQPIRVVHLITGLNTGGAETSLYRLVTAQHRDEFQSTVFSMTTLGPIGDKLRAAGIDVHALGMTPGLPSPVAALRFLAALRRIRPTVLQTWLYHADLLGLIAGTMSRIPAICWNIRCSVLANTEGQSTVSPMVRVLARLSRWPSLVISNSQAGMDLHARRGYRPRRWQVIPNGIDTDHFSFDVAARQRLRADLGIPPDAAVVGMVARYDPVKGFDTFFRAASILGARRADVHFVIVGNGASRANPRILELLAPCKIAPERLHLLGEQSAVVPFFSTFDVATSCSLGEGFPNVVAEAMSCGVSAVVTDVGDSALIVGQTGSVVAPGNAEHLAAAWGDVLALPAQERRALGQRARQRVVEVYSSARMVRSYGDTYRALAAGVTD